MTTLDDYLCKSSNGASLEIGEDWAQGRTTFGGLSAALTLAAIEREANGLPLRSLSVNFCAPLFVGAPCHPQIRLLRAGKSVAHYLGELRQNDTCCTLVTACYGAARESDVVIAADRHPTGTPGEGMPIPYTEGITPAFIQHIDLRYQEGLPYTGSRGKVVNGWMRFKHGDHAMTSTHLVGLIDVWPPAVLQHLSRPAPAATVSWQLDLVNPTDGLQREHWLHYEAVIREAHGGYGHTEARICREDGTVLALSRQLVSVFDKRS